MKIPQTAVINDAHVAVELKYGKTANAAAFNDAALRATVAKLGANWQDADVIVEHFPKQGIALQKRPGFEQLAVVRGGF